ncbi:MAG: phosphoribosylamine--glycine ligase [Trueperaceae bacterium]
MKVLVIGSGGREHALAWALARGGERLERLGGDPGRGPVEVVVAPGNDGMASVARVVGGSSDVASLRRVAQEEAPDLVVIGPEAPLVEGLADDLRADGFLVFGPGRDGARLEGSKSHAKAFMRRHGIPTAAFRSFQDEEAALAYVDEVGAPVVVKDSNLAAGKGVTVAEDLETARAAVRAVFTQAGAELVIEERLVGQEMSLLVLTDGDAYQILPPAQDYKQAYDDDRGPMTGGMGVVAPVEIEDDLELAYLRRSVIERTLRGLKDEGVAFRGVLYFGLMRTSDGPKVLEYNVRFGDPETQAVLPLLISDLADLLAATANGTLHVVKPRWSSEHAACVVMAAPGYPGTYLKGIELTLPEQLPRWATLFHAGTERVDGRFRSAGGRVLAVVATGPTRAQAVARAYQVVDEIGFPDAVVRRDIGARQLR